MTQEKRKPTGWLNVAVDYGPLIVFLAVFKLSEPNGSDMAATIAAIIRGTGAFVVAAIAALVFSRLKFGRISPMLWLSTLLIVGFGSLTVWLNDPFYIQVKPTVIYLFFAAVLFGGLLRGKAMLKLLLQSAFDGLSDEGWRKLSRNWAVWFVVLAIANEVLRRTLPFDGWLQANLWGVSAASFAFTFAQVPMLLRHGLGADGESEVETTPPQG